MIRQEEVSLCWNLYLLFAAVCASMFTCIIRAVIVDEKFNIYHGVFCLTQFWTRCIELKRIFLDWMTQYETNHPSKDLEMRTTQQNNSPESIILSPREYARYLSAGLFKVFINERDEPDTSRIQSAVLHDFYHGS